MEASSSVSSNTATPTSQPPSVAQALYQTLVSVIEQFRFYAFGRNAWNGIDPNVYEAIYRVAQRQRRQSGFDPTTTKQQETLLLSLVWAMDQANMEYIVDFLRENNNDVTKTMITNLEFRLCSLAPGPASTAAVLNVLSNFLQDGKMCKLQTLSLNFFPLGIQGVSQLLFPLFSASSCNTNSINRLQLCNIGLHGVEGGECLAALLSSAHRQQGNEKNHNNDDRKSTLQVLDCSDNQLGPDGAGALFALPSNAIARRASTTATFLKELNLARCSIGDRGIHLMAMALSSTNSRSISRGLTTLNLSENQLTWECLTDLATILQCGMTKLEHLVLSGNGGLLPQNAARMETKRSHFWKALHQNTTLTRLSLDGCSGDHDDNEIDEDDDDCHDSFYTSMENDVLRRNVYLKWANVLLRHGSFTRCCTSASDHHLDACEKSLLLSQGIIHIGQDTTMAGATAVFLMIQQSDIINHHHDHNSGGRNSTYIHFAGFITLDDTLRKGRNDTKAPPCLSRRSSESTRAVQQQNGIGPPSSLELLVTTRTRAYNDDGRDDGTPPIFFDPFGLTTGSWTDWIIAVIVVMAYLHLVTRGE